MSDNKKDKLVNVQSDLLPALMKEVEGKIVVVRGQKALLDQFLERGAITQAQHDKSLHDLTVKMREET